MNTGQVLFKTILYPTDFSTVAQKALGYIKQLRHSGAEEVVVLHVFDQRELRNLAALGGLTGNWPINLDEELKKREAEHLEAVQEIVTEFNSVGFRAKGIVREGIPLREILQTAETEGISLIVIGSHGKTNLQEVMLGSVSEGVIRLSRQPVLVIKRDSQPGKNE